MRISISSSRRRHERNHASSPSRSPRRGGARAAGGGVMGIVTAAHDPSVASRRHLASIVDEAGETLIRASHSTNIKERRDCSTALFNAAGETLCQAEHIPIHLGSFLDLVPHIMRRYPTEDIRPGDAFIGNDAYEGGGTHLPDVVDRGHAHIFQEGLRIPPVRLYRAGELQDDVQDLILLNCQVPSERLSD